MRGVRTKTLQLTGFSRRYKLHHRGSSKRILAAMQQFHFPPFACSKVIGVGKANIPLRVVSQAAPFFRGLEALNRRNRRNRQVLRCPALRCWPHRRGPGRVLPKDGWEELGVGFVSQVTRGEGMIWRSVLGLPHLRL